jgi:ribosome-binding factor A
MDKLEIEESIKALNNAAGYLRTLLASRLSLRITPRLTFHYDESVARGQYLSSLIDRALAADSQHQS